MIPEFAGTAESVSRDEGLHRPHPGDVFKRRCLSKSRLKQPEIAVLMGISPKHLSRFINGHVSVQIELARKLESVTNISAAAWLNYQNAYDLYKTASSKPAKQLIYG